MDKQWEITQVRQFFIVVELIFCSWWPVNHLHKNKNLSNLGPFPLLGHNIRIITSSVLNNSTALHILMITLAYLEHVLNAGIIAMHSSTTFTRKMSPPPSTTHLWRDHRTSVLLTRSAAVPGASPPSASSSPPTANGATGARLSSVL